MKINMRKKVLNLAIASAIGAAGVMSLPAHAVNVSQNNVGQVLLFPYYTVKNGFDTLFTVTNTSARTVVAKVRWREALNSREVRDFNIVLSPYDVWTAGVTKDKAATGALVRTWDNTCTVPALPASTDMPGSREIAFTSIGYDGTQTAYPYDNGGKGIDRVQEGYFEVFNMGEFPVETGTIAVAAKHAANGVPKDCAFIGASVVTDYATLVAPTNVLKGAVTYINVTNGQAVDATPTAIESWTSAVEWAPSDSLLPDLSSGDAGMTANFLNNGAAVAVPAIARPQDAVSVLLMANAVVNEFVADATSTFTDWVVTFPTKHHYTDRVATAPWAVTFQAGTHVPGESCRTISPVLFNREEGTETPSGNAFSPAPAGNTLELCYEANIITFNASNVFGTSGSTSHPNHLSISTTGSVGPTGWAHIGLTGAGSVNSISGFPGAAGLPVIGFAALDRNNASTTNNNRNYGSTVQHMYRRW